ncbi:DNA polymerase epsilon subunit 3 [Chamberlinius hualienensis]
MAERPEDLNLPRSVVSRIVKEVLPEGVNLSKESRAAISKAASVFVLYATSCANNFAMKAKRKTLNGQDVLSAMESMEFEKFVQPLKESLDNFRQDLKDKKEASEKRKKSTVKPSNNNIEENEKGDEVSEDEAEEEAEDEETPSDNENF